MTTNHFDCSYYNGCCFYIALWLFFKTENQFLILRTVSWTEIVFSWNNWQISESRFFFNFHYGIFKSYKSRITCELVSTIIKSWPSVSHCSSARPPHNPYPWLLRLCWSRSQMWHCVIYLNKSLKKNTQNIVLKYTQYKIYQLNHFLSIR